MSKDTSIKELERMIADIRSGETGGLMLVEFRKVGVQVGIFGGVKPDDAMIGVLAILRTIAGALDEHEATETVN